MTVTVNYIDVKSYSIQTKVYDTLDEALEKTRAEMQSLGMALFEIDVPRPAGRQEGLEG